MQNELETTHPGAVRLHAVNAIGVGGLADMAIQGDIPLLQDDATAQVWTAWGANYRDVVILNADNEVVGVVNLTTTDLQQLANYNLLRDELIAAIAP